MTKQQLKTLNEDQLNTERESVMGHYLKAGFDEQRNVEAGYKRQLANVDAEFKTRNLTPREIIDDDIPF